MERVERRDLVPPLNASPRSTSQSLYAAPERPGPRSSSRALLCPFASRVRSTIPVNSLGSTPSVLDRLGRHVMPHMLINPKDRDPLEAGRVGISGLQHGSDRPSHRAPPVPSWRPTALTEACSRRICSIAHRHARAVSTTLGVAICSSCSTNDPTLQAARGRASVACAK